MNPCGGLGVHFLGRSTHVREKAHGVARVMGSKTDPQSGEDVGVAGVTDGGLTSIARKDRTRGGAW
ncbi:hypothetical protein L484_025450 [Morus notabilis]|uniref:Uncharacterized protein n=1 Tax=Morus notabilis TaxID=981085 RepID=W9RWS6_9ROSA|nr:hypothetical protein L484_025450 [Morus notabilis]